MTEKPLTKTEAAGITNEARLSRGVSWELVAQTVDAPLIWTISAVLGQQPMSQSKADAIGALLDLPSEVVSQLTRQPSRGTGSLELPSDPTLYRFYEALMVYGPALKEWVHEEFGDGIMSAINFGIEVERVSDPAGDRVSITFNGKFLPYQWS